MSKGGHSGATTTVFTAKPLPHKAQGCDAVATLGKRKNTNNLEEVASVALSNPRQPLRGCVNYYPDTQGSLRSATATLGFKRQRLRRKSALPSALSSSSTPNKSKAVSPVAVAPSATALQKGRLDAATVLITGGAGFIGSHIAEQLQGRARTVRVLDNLRTGRRRNLDGLRVEFVEDSILNRDALRAAMRGVDYVFHLAALVSVPESVGRPHECVSINVTGTLNVLEAAAAAGVKKLFFASSAAVYGDNPSAPKLETMLPEPRSPYAVTKLDGEFYCRQFAEAGRLDTVAFRFFNVFGPRQDPGGAYAAAVPIFMQKALAGEPLVIFGDGGQTRDFIHVKDLAAACIHAVTTPGPALRGVFNAGYGGQTTILELARRIIELAGSRSEIRHAPERAGDVRHSRASVDALARAGYRLRGSLEDGLRETLEFFKTQTPRGARAARAGERAEKRAARAGEGEL